MVTLESILTWIRELQKKYAAEKAYLTELDSAIGDADHGINMDRGFAAVCDELAKNEPTSIANAFKTIAMVLIKTVGGASGPLYGTFFLKASMAANGKESLTASDLCTVFEAGIQGVKERGKAVLGEKTMIDALEPALDALKAESARTDDPVKAMSAAAAAAEKGMQATIDLLAKKGRASYLGERSIGHQDPGATSSFYLLDLAAKTWG